MATNRPKPLKVSVAVRMRRFGDSPVDEATRLTGRKVHVTLFDSDRTESELPEMALTIKVSAPRTAEEVRKQLEGLRANYDVIGEPRIIRPGDVAY